MFFLGHSVEGLSVEYRFCRQPRRRKP